MNMDSMDCDNKYQHGKIYKLTSSETTDIYIGSTTQPLCKRLQEHKCDYNLYLKGKFCYVSSYELVKYVDCKIELIKEYPCNNKNELEREEGYYQRKMKCVNICIAGRTKQEYRDDNKEKRSEYEKNRYANNRETIKEKVKKYREENKDIIREKKKKYREENKEKIKAKRSKKCICECGKEYTHDHKARHEKSKKHQDYIKENNN